MNKTKECGTPLKPLLSVFVMMIFAGQLLIGLPVSADENYFELLQAVHLEEPLVIPDFSLPSIEGDMVTLSDFHGKVVLLNFWATWCGYCQKERPSLQVLFESYQEKDVVVLSVSIDRGEIDAVKEFVGENELTFPNLHDQDGNIAVMYGVRGVPSTFFIDRNGKAVGGAMGPREWDSEAAYGLIEQLLSEAD